MEGYLESLGLTESEKRNRWRNKEECENINRLKMMVVCGYGDDDDEDKVVAEYDDDDDDDDDGDDDDDNDDDDDDDDGDEGDIRMMVTTIMMKRLRTWGGGGVEIYHRIVVHCSQIKKKQLSGMWSLFVAIHKSNTEP